MKNLSIAYSKINQTTKDAGLSWYTSANLFCRDVSADYGIPLDKVCGVLSALSPGTGYDTNKKDCINLIKQFQGNGSFKFTTYPANVRKALSILKSNDSPITFFSRKTGAKTHSFYCNILNPFNSDTVTIDRHAYLIATGDVYTNLHLNQYEAIESHYIKEANKIGIRPLELQAVLWVNHRIENDIQQRKDVPF